MSLFDALKDVESGRTGDVVVPVLPGKTQIGIARDSALLRYPIPQLPCGFWKFTLKGKRALHPKRASALERLDYLFRLNRFMVVLVTKEDDHWLVFPYSWKDVSQRGWKQGVLKRLYLVDDNVGTGDVVDARYNGDLLYLGTPGMRFNVSRENIETVEQVKEELTLQERVEGQLTAFGGRLHEIRDTEHGLTVEWSWDGHRLSSIIEDNDDLSLVSAGFCIDGADRDYNLSAAVALLARREGEVYYW